MSKPTGVKKQEVEEQNFRNNMVQVMRRQLFLDGEPESECLETMQMLVASRIARRKDIEWSDIHELVEQLAVEAKPFACEIIERAKKAGVPCE